MTTYQVPDRPIDLSGARFEGEGNKTDISDWHSSVAYARDEDTWFLARRSLFTSLKNEPGMIKRLKELEVAELAVFAKFGCRSDKVDANVSELVTPSLNVVLILLRT